MSRIEPGETGYGRRCQETETGSEVSKQVVDRSNMSGRIESKNGSRPHQ